MPIACLPEPKHIARLPWDADCSAWWRPGGRTYRLDRDEYGLREVVHDRIRGEHLVASIDTLA